MKDNLVPYTCPKCGHHLVDAPRGASVSCPTCSVWVKASKSLKGVSRNSAGSRDHPPDAHRTSDRH